MLKKSIRNVATVARQMILTATSIIVIVTVIFCGGLTPFMIDLLKIKSADQAADTSFSPQELVNEQNDNEIINLSNVNNDNKKEDSSIKKFILKLGIFKMWHGFDKSFMKPFLTHYSPSLIESRYK